MYPVSDDYRAAMKRPVQRHSISGTIGDVPFARENLLSFSGGGASVAAESVIRDSDNQAEAENNPPAPDFAELPPYVLWRRPPGSWNPAIGMGHLIA